MSIDPSDLGVEDPPPGDTHEQIVAVQEMKCLATDTVPDEAFPGSTHTIGCTRPSGHDGVHRFE